MALAAEAGELLAEFQWLTTDESMLERLSSEQRNAIAMEIADVMIYLVRLCDVLQIDLVRAAETKLVRGHEKVSTGGQLRSPLVAMKSPRWWPREVLTPY